MINKKHKALIERRLARLEKAINEGMRCESFDDIDEMAHDWFISQEWDEDDYWVKAAGGKFDFIQNIANKAADHVVDACCDAIGVDPDSPERDIVENSLANAADTALVDPGYWDDDDYDDDWDDDEDDMYESRRRKLERRVRILERKLADEGILDSIKNVASKISGKAADAKLSAKELANKLKLELETMALGITSKLDDAVGKFTWGNPIIQAGSNGIVQCRIVGENGSLPHTKRAKDNVAINLEVDTNDADRLKDCVVNYDVYINSKATTASAPDPISNRDKLLSLLKPNEWKKIAQSFKPVFNKYVEDNT